MIDSPVMEDRMELKLVRGDDGGVRDRWEANLPRICSGWKYFHVGEKVGMGQTVKASCSLIGSTGMIFESLVLGAGRH